MGWRDSISAALGLQVKKTAAPTRGLPFIAASQDGRPISAQWTTERAVTEGLKSSTWVYTACRRISTALASVPLVVQRRNGDEWEPDPTHPLQALLDRPNPYMSRQDMLERWALHLELGGNALWHKVLVQGRPVELWPLQPDQIKPIPSRIDFISGYEWKQASEKRVLDGAEVLHWQFVDPSTPYWGLSPLMAAANAVDTDLAAVRWNRAVLANDGKPSLAVFLDSELNEAQQEIAARFIQGQIDGNSTRKALVLGGASKAQPLSMNAAEMDWLQGRRMSREEIGAVFGVPPVLMVAGESVTFANLEAAKRILWEDTVVPLLDDLCQGLGMGLLPHYGAELTHRVVADVSGIAALQDNMTTRATAAKTLIDAGFPINAVNQRLGLGFSPVDGGDVPRQPVVPAAPAPAQAKQRVIRMQRKAADDGVDAQLARMDAWSDEARTRVAELLIDQGNAVAAAYASGKSIDAALSMDDWQALMTAIHTAVIEAEGAFAFTALLAATTAAGGGGTFDVLADNIVDWIDDHVATLVTGINETSRVAVAAQIKQGVEAGESQKDIAKRLRGLHEDWSTYRAKVIARTEVGAAFGQAHQASAEQISEQHGVKLVKRWLTAKDSRVRDAHVALNGETVALDEQFSNGAMSAPAGINCRCCCVYSLQ